MRNVSTIVVVCLLCLFAAAPTLADPFGHGDGYDGGTASWDKLADYGGYHNGGEFTLDGASLLLSNSAYASSTSGVGSSGAGSFQTFCMERGEWIYEPMRIWVSTEFLNGTPGSHAWEGGTGSGDNLDPMTAYLYTQFAKGTLSIGGSYNYTPGVGRKNSADQLQHAIWAIEGEWTLGQDGWDDTIATAWVTAAQTAVSAGTWVGIGDVRVLQMYKQIGDDDFVLKQDQLYLVPVPGAVLLGMLGLGAAGLKLRRFA